MILVISGHLPFLPCWQKYAFPTQKNRVSEDLWTPSGHGRLYSCWYRWV